MSSSAPILPPLEAGLVVACGVIATALVIVVSCVDRLEQRCNALEHQVRELSRVHYTIAWSVKQ